MSFSYVPIDCDVIIIGGGVSGLTATITLLAKEPTLHVVVLEAEEEIGGRVLFSKNDSTANCGASWISPDQTNLVKLLETLKIKTKSRKTHNSLIEFTRVAEVKRSEIHKICRSFEKFDLIAFITRIETLCGFPDLIPEYASMSMSEFIEAKVRTELVRSIARFLIWSNCGLSPADITVAFYVMFCTSTRGIVHQLLTTEKRLLRQLRIQGGALQICNKIAALHPNHTICGQRVTGITSQPRQVKVETSQASLHCFYVVVAIPPSEIAKIRFQPPLPASKIAAITSSIPGKLGHFMVTYAKVFWTVDDIQVLNEVTPDRPVICCFDVTDDTPAISGYFLGTAKNSRAAVLKQLGEYLGEEALAPVGYAERVWPTGGPMACVKSFDALLALLEPLNRVFWAGAETSSEWYGTLGGAVHAGERAALEVLYELRPASLTPDDITIIMSPFGRKKKLSNYEDFYRTLMKWHVTVPVTLGVLFILYKTWRKGWWLKFWRQKR